MSIKFLVLGAGGYFGFWGGGGSADFIFMGARIFLIHGPFEQILGFAALGSPAARAKRDAQHKVCNTRGRPGHTMTSTVSSGRNTNLLRKQFSEVFLFVILRRFCTLQIFGKGGLFQELRVKFVIFFKTHIPECSFVSHIFVSGGCLI